MDVFRCVGQAERKRTEEKNRNDNGSGSGQVFQYPNPTHLLNVFFSETQTRSRQAPLSPTRFGPNLRPKSWPNQKNLNWSPKKKKKKRIEQNRTANRVHQWFNIKKKLKRSWTIKLINSYKHININQNRSSFKKKRS